jgi:hypothetical protein
MLPLTWCACYFPKIIILRFEVISEKIRKNPVNTEKTFSMYYNSIGLSIEVSAMPRCPGARELLLCHH